MSLQACPECGGSVSTQAASCPHCGYRVATLGQQRERPSRPASLVFAWYDPRRIMVVGSTVLALVALLALVQVGTGVFWTDVSLLVLLPIGPVTTVIVFLYMYGMLARRRRMRDSGTWQLYVDVVLVGLFIYLGDSYVAYLREVGRPGLFLQWFDHRISGREYAYWVRGTGFHNTDGSLHEVLRALAMIGFPVWGVWQGRRS